MGLSTSATHLIYFIASVVVAGSFIGIAASVVVNISNGMQNRGDMIAKQLSEDFAIINDPERVSNNPLLLYLKNTGRIPLSVSHITVLVDGIFRNSTVIEGKNDSWMPGEVVVVSVDVNLSAGQHVVKVILDDGLTRDFKFRV